jgi:hypothetical protein
LGGYLVFYTINEIVNVSLKSLIKELQAYFKTLMISYEFTREYNIHAHIYFYTELEDIFTFEQNFKRLKNSYKSIGRNYKLNKIDDVTEVLKEYPFKDIERTIKYSKTENCLFNPYHCVIRSKTLGSLRSPENQVKFNINILEISFVNCGRIFLLFH